MVREAKPYTKYVLVAIEKIKQHIDENPLKYRTAGELLETLGLGNRNLMEKAFKDVYAAGIKEYQVRKRLEESKKFLKAGMNKKQIAAKCFYRSQSSYCKAFRKVFKTTPTEWQNSN